MNMRLIAKKTSYHAKKHKYKIMVGAPIVFALFVNIQAVETGGATMSLVSHPTPFVEIGDTVRVETTVQSPPDINAIGGTVMFNPEALAVSSITETGSVIDLWAERPQITDVEGEVIFGGGITEGTYAGNGSVFSMNMKALAPGTHVITLSSPEILAHDGSGTNILTGKEDLTLYVREAGYPSPDLNGDEVITLMDLNIMYFNTFKQNNARYDLNQDGTVDLDDVREILKLM